MLKSRLGLSLLYTDTKLSGPSQSIVVIDLGNLFFTSQNTARPLYSHGHYIEYLTYTICDWLCENCIVDFLRYVLKFRERLIFSFFTILFHEWFCLMVFGGIVYFEGFILVLGGINILLPVYSITNSKRYSMVF